jgi:hypothetical protein
MLPDAGKYFWRSEICCLLTVNDAGIWWGHLGLVDSHPSFGANFVRLHPVSVGATAIPPMLKHETLRARWWLAFEGGYSQASTLDRLKIIADQLAVLARG